MPPESPPDSPPDSPDARPADAASANGQGRAMSLAEALSFGQELLRDGRLDAAEAVFLQVLQAAPGDPDALNFFGVLRFQQGKPDEALEFLVHAVRGAPDAPEPWLNLANVLIETGHHDDAIKALQQVVSLAPDSVQAHNNLAVLHMRRGEHEAAEATLKRALALDDDVSYLHYNLSRLYMGQGRLKECAAHAMRTSHIDPAHPKARQLRARSMMMLGDREGALQQLRDWAASDPDSVEARHYLAAAGGAEVPAQAATGYVESLFDGFAASFDVQLERLGYQAPALVAQRLAQHWGERAPGELLDAGCGTGLCAPLLRPMAARLEGVDLSTGMLARARTRGGYDALHHEELTAFLEHRPLAWDAVVSADVLNYFGELRPVLRATRAALRPGGLLVATVEQHEDEAQAYGLGIHGRYVHSQHYLRQAVADAGLVLLSVTLEQLRSEALEPVRGWLFVARREPADRD